MALTRNMLKGMGLTDEQVGAIIEEHANTVDGLKADRDKYKTEAEKVAGLEKKIKELESDTSGEEWEKKYNSEHEAFEKYKGEIEVEKKNNAVKAAYKKLLSSNKVGEKHIDSILRVTDISKMKLDKDGNLENADKLSESIKSDWSGFITSTETKGSNVENPPAENKDNGSKAGRAAQLAAQYHDSLYGSNKEG